MSDSRTPLELWSYFIYMYTYIIANLQLLLGCGSVEVNVLCYVLLLRVCEIKCLHSALYKEGIYMKSTSSPMENQ